MTAFVDHPMGCAPSLETDGMTDFERQAAERYFETAGLDRTREERLAELRTASERAPVRRVRRTAR
jgi:hypothetical protein